MDRIKQYIKKHGEDDGVGLVCYLEQNKKRFNYHGKNYEVLNMTLCEETIVFFSIELDDDFNDTTNIIGVYWNDLSVEVKNEILTEISK